MGTFVEVRRNQQTVRTGMVEEAMPDGSATWIAADGARPRRIFEKSEGFLVYVEPQQLTEPSTYRMALDQLHVKHAHPHTTP